MSRPGAAIVGAGLMGRWHAHALRRLGIPVLAVVDANHQRAESMARTHSGARAHQSLSAALADEAIAVVHVCTPTASHVELAEAALTAGRHVLVEKPLAETAGQTAWLLELAASRNRLLCPIHQFPFQDGFRQLTAARNRLGELVELYYVACSAGAEGGTAQRADLVAQEILPHPLSLFSSALEGQIGELEWVAERPAAGELRAAARMGSTSLSLSISMTARPTRNQLELRGSAGSGWVDLFHGFGVVEGGGVSRLRKLVRPFSGTSLAFAAAAANLSRRVLRREPAYPGLRALLRTFYRAAGAAGAAPFSAAEILDVARARDRIIAQVSGIAGASVVQGTS